MLTVSGGVSLGAYEGGFLYYLLRVMQASGLPMRVRLAAGTSAGSVNSLLALLYSCGGLPEQPEDSLFYQTWMPLGIDMLFAPEEVTATGALSRRWLEEVARRIDVRWQAGLPSTCDVVWGVATTRLTPRPVNLAHKRLMLPRMEEKFALHIAGQGPGVPPFVRNYIDPKFGLEQAMVPHDADGHVGFSAIRELVFASTAVPIAFPPQQLRYCHRDPPPGEPHRCLDEDALDDPFVDGALFDNTPLRHAARLAAGGLTPDANGSLVWRPMLLTHPPPLSPQVGFAFLTHEATDYATEAPPGSQSPPTGALELIERLAATFVSTARTKELYTLLEEMPQIREMIFLPRRHFPTAGGLMNAFLGFFEADFRLFDFTLGMYDARRMFEREMMADESRRPDGAAPIPPLVYPEDVSATAARLAGPGHAESPMWQRLRCMRQVLDDNNLDPPDCRPSQLVPAYASSKTPGPGTDTPTATDTGTETDTVPAIDTTATDLAREGLQNFRILLQVGLERLWSTCGDFDPQAPPATENAACRAAMAGGSPPVLAGVRRLAGDAWHRRPHEAELTYALRLLSARGFAFRGLGLGAEDAALAPTALRQKVWQIGRALVDKQPKHQRRPTRLALELGVEAFSHRASQRVFTFALGRQLAIAYSRTLMPVRLGQLSPHWQAGLVLDNLPSLLTSNGGSLALGPVLGIEVEPAAWSSSVVHPHLSLVSGFMFAAGDRFSARSCAPRRGQLLGDCSRPLLQASVGLDLLRHLRVDMVGSVYPPMRAGEHVLWAVSPSLGLAFW